MLGTGEGEHLVHFRNHGNIVFDLSAQPFEQNVRETREAVDALRGINSAIFMASRAECWSIMTRRLTPPLCCIAIWIAVVWTAGCSHQRQTSTPSTPTVVFVCEHGAAKSVIAAAYFNKLAAERHLNFHAIARGLTPQPELSTAAATGLKKDGVPYPNETPRRLSHEESQGAVLVVAFCPMPKTLRQARVESFDVPAPNEGYDSSRDAILVHVKGLLDQLALKANSATD